MRRPPGAFGASLLALAIFTTLVSGATTPASATPQPQYVQRGPILIQSNSDFTAANGVTGGSGTPSSPYVISGWQLTTAYANQIVIENTTDYFRVDGVWITVSQNYADVELTNATHGAVVNSTLYGGSGTQDFPVTRCRDIVVSDNAFSGVRVWASLDVSLTVANNTGGASFVDTSSDIRIEYNSPAGDDVRVSGSANVTVKNNTMSAGGIFIDTSSNLSVVGNSLTGSGESGMIFLTCQNMTIRDNALMGRGYVGLSVGGTNATVEGNNVTGTSGDGIDLAAANGTAQGNDLVSNQGAGLVLQGSNLTVRANRLIRNGLLAASASSAHLATYTITPDNLVNGLPALFYEGCSNLVLDGTVAGQIIVANCLNAQVRNVTFDQYVQQPLQFAYVSGGSILDSNFTNGAASASGGLQGYEVYVAGSSSINISANTFRNNTGGAIALDTDTGTRVWHNNIIAKSSAIQVYQLEYDANGVNNHWDDGYPAGGNFWSVYAGVDDCSGPLQNVCPDPDGIGDMPFGPDNYPLMRPWGVVTPPPVANFTAPSIAFLGGYGAPVDVDASPSTDQYSFIQLYKWDFGDGTFLNISWATTSHSYYAYGRYRINLTVVDAIGLSNSTVRWVTVTGYPAVTISISPTQPVMNLPVVFNGSGSSDAFGRIVNYTWTFSGTGPAYGASVTRIFQSTTGTLSVTLAVTDNRSISNSATRLFTVIQDTTPPATSVHLSGTRGTNGWYVSSVMVSLTATDDYSGIVSTSFVVDGGAWQTYGMPFSLGEGIHTLEYRSTDGSGNVESNETTSVAVDLTPPSVEITAPIGPQSAGNILINWSGADTLSGLASYAVSLDGGPFNGVGTNTSTVVTWSAGNHSIAVRAADVAGNLATAKRDILVQAAPSSPGGPFSPSSEALLGIGLAAVVLAFAAAFYVLRRRRRPPAASTAPGGTAAVAGEDDSVVDRRDSP